jgi:hypothetical protein
MEDLPDGLTGLSTRLEALEQRVYALEHPAAVSPIAEQLPSPTVRIEGGEKLLPAPTVGAFSLLGKAMLGIAGAYLLRAVAASNVASSAAIAAVAIFYALAWLVWASRAKSGDWLTGTIYTCTSALILAPMLWELMLRFSVLTAPITAAVVAGFVVAASVLAWKRDLAPVLWVANLTAALLALGLGIASREMVPFIGALLVMVLIGEYGALRGKDSGVRVVVSVAADAAVWALIFIYSSAESTRTSYPQLSAATLIAPGMILFSIVGVSVICRTLIAGRRISIFETLQTMATFLLAACSLIYFGPATSVIGLGIGCLALAGAGYAVAAIRFRGEEERRNLVVFASWSGALMLAGSMMCLPAKVQSPLLGMWALVASWTGARMFRLHLELHGLAFLLAAAAGSGLLSWTLSELAGTPPGAAASAVYFIHVCAIVCYAGVMRKPGQGWQQQVVAIAFAVVAAMSVMALLVQGLMGLLAFKVVPGAHHLAFIRTLAICAGAMGLVFSGARWGRTELTKIGYATLALLVVKLMAEDLRHGQLAFIAGSIFLFAITLIVVPQLARVGQRAKGAVVINEQSIPSLPR